MRSWFCLLVTISLVGAVMPAAEAGGKARNVGATSVKSSSATTVRSFARTKPPRAYAGQNPGQAARPQNRR